MAISSLPSPYGIGTLGKSAYEFVDFLRAAGQSYWQLLPLGPTSYGASPYQSFSTFAGNPYLIDLDMLIEEGLLTEDEVKSIDWGGDPRCVDYGKIYSNRYNVLKLAKQRGHSTAAQAATVAAQTGAKNLILGHYSKRYTDEQPLLLEAQQHFGGRVLLANEGMKIDLTK